MPDYSIKIDFTSDDDKILSYVVKGLQKMRETLVSAAGEVGDCVYGGNYTYDRSNAVSKIKTAAYRMLDIAGKIEDIDLQLEQIAEDRPNVGKS